MLLEQFFRHDIRDAIVVESIDLFAPVKATLLLAPERAKEINTVVARAKAVLKKPDRIVAFLRLYNAALLNGLWRNERDPERAAGLTKLYQKVRDDLQKRSQKVHGVATVLTAEDEALLKATGDNVPFLHLMEHFLSLPIPEIDKLQFGYQTPTSIVSQMEGLEKNWQGNQSDRFEAGAEGEVILAFPNGLAWINLNRAFCKKEASAMGHCGNEPRQHTGDTLLSLRRIDKIGLKTYHKPYLTFVLHDNGLLGEMKGRFNKRPNKAFEEGIAPSDFSDEIVALLKLPMIKGIVGGGYLPHQNFHIDDLPDSVRDNLLEEKPELGGIARFYAAYGDDDARFWPLLRARLSALNLKEPDFEGQEFVLAEWSNFESFISDVEYRDALHKLVMVLEATDSDASVDEGDVYQIVANLSDDVQQVLARRLGVGYTRPNTPSYHRMLSTIARGIMSDDGLFREIRIAVERSKTGAATRDDIRRRIDEYIDIGWPWECHYVDLRVPRLQGDGEGSVSLPTVSTDQGVLDLGQEPVSPSSGYTPVFDLDAPVKLTISLEDFCNVISTDPDDHEDDESYMLMNVKTNGWVSMDADLLAQRRRYAGIEDDEGSEALADTEGGIDYAYATDLFRRSLGL